MLVVGGVEQRQKRLVVGDVDLDVGHGAIVTTSRGRSTELFDEFRALDIIPIAKEDVSAGLIELAHGCCSDTLGTT